ncbi:hypothetical protein MBLNU459_g1799t2 [Dothideomycetes sp. NU459]
MSSGSPNQVLSSLGDSAIPVTKDTFKISAAVGDHAPSVFASRSAESESTMLAPEDTARMSAAVAEHRTTLLSEGVPAGKKIPVGVVVSAGKMDKTVKVRIPGQKFNKHLRKYFKDDSHHLVHDPKSSLQIGDVVSLRPHRAAKHVHHIVSEILVPFGPPISERPQVPTEADMQRAYNKMRGLKLMRRNLRRSAAQGNEAATEKLKVLGLDLSADGVKAKKGAKKPVLVGKKGQK